MKINVGAGSAPKHGYLSVDIQGGDITAEAWDIPLENASVDAVYSRHMIEHVSRRQADECLAEWFRLLKPGGSVHVLCPDRDKVLADVGNHTIDPKKGKSFHHCAMRSLFGWQRDGYDFHKWAYNPQELAECLAAAGFVQITQHEAPDCNVTGVKP